MKTATFQPVDFARNLGIATLTALALLAGNSQANDRFPHRDGFMNQNGFMHASVPNHYGFGPGFRSQRDAVDHLEDRQRQQTSRIHAGMANNRISGKEARSLLKEQREIDNAMRRYLSDRRLGPREWIELNRMLDRAEHNIRVASHDRRWR
jgi:hypothetical protein